MKKLLITIIIAVVMTVSLVLPLSTNAVQAAPMAKDGEKGPVIYLTTTIPSEIFW